MINSWDDLFSSTSPIDRHFYVVVRVKVFQDIDYLYNCQQKREKGREAVQTSGAVVGAPALALQAHHAGRS